VKIPRGGSARNDYRDTFPEKKNKDAYEKKALAQREGESASREGKKQGPVPFSPEDRDRR